MKSTINPRPVVLAAIIITAGIYRIFMVSGVHSPLANFTPLGAMALFGGCYYSDKWKAYLVPLLTLWLTDIVLNRLVFFNSWVFFYDGFLWVYASFALMVFMGTFIKKVSARSVAFFACIAAVAHWLLTGVGACSTDITNSVFVTLNFQEYGKRLYEALPAMANLMIGNLVFSTLLFTCFEVMQRKFPRLQLQPSS